jgi:hypothetical protein
MVHVASCEDSWMCNAKIVSGFLMMKIIKKYIVKMVDIGHETEVGDETNQADGEIEETVDL